MTGLAMGTRQIHPLGEGFCQLFHNLEELEVQFGKVCLPVELVRRVNILVFRFGTR